MPSRFIPKFVVEFLRVLANEEKKNGIYVCIDRPAAFVQSVLRKAGIDLTRVTFVDAVVRVSGDDRAQRVPVQMLTTPFCTEIVAQLRDVVERVHGTAGGTPQDFLIMDNLGVLSCYCDDRTIERLLVVLEGIGPRRTFFALDPQTNEGLYRLAKEWASRSVDLSADLFKFAAAAG